MAVPMVSLLTTQISAHRSDPENRSLPAEVHVYHSLACIDPAKGHDRLSKVFALPISTYKAVSSADGLTYCLRRVEGFRLVSQMALGAVEPWTRISHSAIVGLREAFTTKLFGDSCAPDSRR